MGAIVIYRSIQKQGWKGTLESTLKTKDKDKTTKTLEVIATGGLQLVKGFGDSLVLSSRIHKLADGDELEKRLKALSNSKPEEEDSLASIADAEIKGTADLGLPTVGDSKNGDNLVAG